STRRENCEVLGGKMEVPHVVILPFPAQGHIKPMFNLSKLLCHAGFDVTLVNTHHNHARILNLTDQTRFQSQFPRLRFMSISDGLPADHPRAGPQATDLFGSTVAVSKPEFRDLIVSLVEEEKAPTCIVADGIMSFAIDVAEEFQIHAITFRTYSATCTWVYFHLQKLVHNGEIPFQENEDMERRITCIPGLEKVLRRKDLPGICRLDSEHPFLQFFISQTSKMTRASALILNTFEELEAPMLYHLRSIFPKVYTVGPLHALLKSRKTESSTICSSNGSLREQDQTCIAWLESQPFKSVIYVSFGSLAILTRDQLMEFWYGLVNSGTKFLWVMRPDLVWEENTVGEVPAELALGTSQRGCIVGWAPQEEVLAHRAIGGFLTHSGWNSTLESTLAGVPMICWPQLADQQVNSMCVSEMWGTGMDMKDTCDRSTVEKMVRDLMEGKRDDIVKSMAVVASITRGSIEEGGLSYGNIGKLIEDIRAIKYASTGNG
ncbi:hypothetical protein RJ639_003389, partial [Escallonia herrerae]